MNEYIYIYIYIFIAIRGSMRLGRAIYSQRETQSYMIYWTETTLFFGFLELYSEVY